MKPLESISNPLPYDEQLFTIALTKIHGLGLQGALTLYKTMGNAADIFNGIGKLKQRYPTLKQRVLQALDEGATQAIRKAEEELRFCHEHQIEVMCLNDAIYPQRLAQCDDAPLVLYYKGNTSLNAAHAVSVVGTRRCTEYGREMCHRLTSELSRCCPDTLVVSGLAYGIDIQAHRGALEAGLPTVAVLAHGLDRIYPYSHRDTAKAMIGKGGLITEYTTGTSPDKGNFVRRNRIIAALSDACIIVESAIKGGAIITARLAFDYNRQVFACPGRISDKYSEGCNMLIRNNTATPFLSATDMATELGWITEEKRRQSLTQGIQTDLFPQLSAEERILADLIRPTDGMQVNLIAQQSGLPIHQATALLFEMEMKGIVRLLPGSVYKLTNA